ncbi:hypothetical protein HHK36_004353 [Tetracentron sinense]|uniref:Reverse transcriptase domain-containing protein n=1 Tax=Tetracentron sinense TaxID=13715 RepID=A0A834ZPV6_TETSI|nr:hypothetical protein HHK36_004353 [Tetracentron sinense]
MFSIMINGSQVGFFPGRRGLRQGDPMSPYLFLIVMQVLSNQLDVGADEGRFSLHQWCSDPQITHLAFADDLFIFSWANSQSAEGIKDLLSSFGRASGLTANFHKSAIFFGATGRATRLSITNTMGMKEGQSLSVVCNKLKKVSQIRDANGWDLPRPQSTSLIEIWDSVSTIKMLRPGDADKIIWSPNPRGVYSLCSAWESIRFRHREVRWHSLVWAKPGVPRFSFVAWMAACGGLLTQDKMVRHKMLDRSKCILCQCHVENENHLFFRCSYSKQVWLEILKFNGHSRRRHGTWNGELDWMAAKWKGQSLKAQIKRLSFSASVYYIWHERNQRIFHNSFLPPSQVIWRISTSVKEFFSGKLGVTVDTPQNREFCSAWNLQPSFHVRVPTWIKWQPPDEGVVCLNSNGSVDQFRAGWGCLFRDSSGVPLFAQAGGCAIQPILLMELEAIKRGLLLAREKAVAHTHGSMHCFILSLVIVLCIDVSLAARHLLDTLEPVAPPPALTLPTIPTLPKPILPPMPTTSLPSLPSVPTLPMPTLPPLPSTQLPTLPKPALPPLPTMPTIPTLPKVALPPLSAFPLPTIPTSIPFIPTSIPFFSPPPSTPSP